jgi:hypothetical protein
LIGRKLRPTRFMLAPGGQQADVVDITGQRFGLVTVTGPAKSVGTGVRWKVRCECGAERFILGYQLRRNPPETHRNCAPAA